MTRIPIYFSILLVLFATANWAEARPEPFRVVLDPGHGGSDEGTVFRTSYARIAEKALTLQLARKVARHLRARGYLVTLTRNDDREVALGTRTQIANRLGAQVFISIHMNSSEEARRKDAEGIETYILNSTTDASSKRLARLENSVISGSPAPFGAPAEDRDVALILKDLRLDGNLSSSKRLACSLQEHLVRATSNRANLLRRNRGVKQALFHVLLGADMPSVLVETGFLNSAKDRSFALSMRGQTIASRAIADAVDH
ncbi:MAG: N-acetylmuramoyl-L-alanine amidase [Bdellovibrionia bacterium]